MSLKQLSIVLFYLILVSCNETDSNSTNMNTTNDTKVNQDIEKKVDALIAKMNLAEKVGQLVQYNGSWDITGPVPNGVDAKAKYEDVKNGHVGSMLNVNGVEATMKMQKLAVEESRLGIPLIIGYDVIHGYQTMFPIPLGESASWDESVAENGARIAATEASAAGIHWTFAPMVDLSRDARWGRVMEGSGEDPYLGARLAVARVKGFQGDDLSKSNTIASCAKHFAAYGFAESGRDYNTVDMSDHTLHNIVLPPFKACVDAGVSTVMNAFNELNGTPATGSDYLQRDILKGDWGFDGFIVSDWASIMEMVPHGRARDLKEAAEIAINAGSDMDMEAYAYDKHLVELVESGVVKESVVDEAVKRVLRIKFRLGLFDDPYRYFDEQREKELIGAKEHLTAAREAAKKSIVLLKNEGNVLPLSKDMKKIAVIGPLANDKDSPLGSWRGKAIAGSAVSVLEGINNAVSSPNNVSHEQGCILTVGERSFTQEVKINETDETGIKEAVALAKKSDIVIMVVGEDCFQSGEGRSRTNVELPGVQKTLLKEVYAVNKNIVMVLMNGRPLAIKWAAENIPAIVETWHLGSESGNAIADVLFGDYNPAGKLPVTFPRSTGQVPIYYNHKNTGRPVDQYGMVFWSHFIDEANDGLFPFGYGLSYTNFEYSPIRLSSETMTVDGELTVSTTVKNTGERDGEEVVQLYIHDLHASVTRPIKELKGFQKITLKAGESKEVNFKLTKSDLAFYGRKGKWITETGKFDVFVGTNSRDVAKASFELTE